MTLKSLLPRPWLTLIFVALILVTRTNSNSAIIDPPDATLGVFFLAGLWACGSLSFGLLFGACVAADFISFALGVSDWCFTPAYVFLVPTYACLWYTGHFSRKLEISKVSGLAKLAAWLMVGCIGAYFISSQSFLMFSGRYPATLSTVEYWSKIFPHFPRYIEWAYAYTAIGLGIAFAAKKFGRDIQTSNTRPT
jgi:hypothetical protein